MLDDLIHRLRALFRRPTVERELDEDLRFHVDHQVAKYTQAGCDPAEALRRTRLEFGGLDQIKEEYRDTLGLRLIDDLRQDVRHAMRALRAAPMYALAVMATLALGIGANVAVFSLVSAVLFTPLPYPDADRLVMILATQPKTHEQAAATSSDFLAWQERATFFEAMGTERELTGDVAGEPGGTPAETVPVQAVRASVFQALGVDPALGRTFRADEHPVGAAAPVVVISDQLWSRHYARDPAIVGKTIRVDGVPRTVIGVMPPTFSFWDPRPTALWLPLSFTPGELITSGRAFVVVARLKAGVTIEQAQAGMDAVTASIAKDVPSRAGWGAHVVPIREALYAGYAERFLFLQAAVGCVLLIACVNVAGLLFARGSARRGEIALRVTIGANRGRIIRQLFTENVLLAAMGGVASVGVGWLALTVLAPLSSWVPHLHGIGLSGRVVAFTALVSMATPLLFGLVPAVHTSRADFADALKSAPKGGSSSLSRRSFQGGLIITQVGLAVLLLVGSGLLINSFLRIKANDLGGDPRGVLTFSLQFSSDTYQKRTGSDQGASLIELSPVPARTFERVWERLQTTPTLKVASGSGYAPFAGVPFRATVSVDGRPDIDAHGEPVRAASIVVTPNFFATMRTPVISGRDFDARDQAGSPWGAVVNEALASTYFPGQNALGQHLTLNVAPNARPREIIGIVRNMRLSPYDQLPTPAVYTLYAQQQLVVRWPFNGAQRNMTFVVRPTGDPSAAAASIRQLMAEIDPAKPITEIHALDEDLAEQLAAPRYLMVLLSVFAGVALLLSSVGIYGSIAYQVAQRTREIGIRVALGASRASVLGLAMRQMILFAGIGVVAGLLGAVAASRTLATLLWRLKPTDPPTYIAVAVVMAVVAVVATYLPARRALRVPPTVALRQE